MKLGDLVHKAVALVEADAVKVKDAIVKAAMTVDTVIKPEAEVLKPLIEQVAQSIAPGGKQVVDVAYAWFEASAKLLDSGDAAIQQHFLDAGLDVALISQVKGLVPALKAAAKQQ